MLSARRAGGHAEAGAGAVGSVAGGFVFGGQPEPGTGGSVGERRDRAADAAHERMHDGAKQWAPLQACRRPQREPGQDLGLGHGPSDPLLQGGGQRLQGTGLDKLLVQGVDDFVVRQSRVQRLPPAAAVAVPVPIAVQAWKRSARQGPVGRANPASCRVFVFDCAHALVEDACVVVLGRRRQEPSAGPELGLVVFADGCHIPRRDAKEPRGEVACRFRVLPVHDGGGSGDARRALGPHVAEGAKAAEQTGGLGPHDAREGVGLVKHQVVQARAGE